MAGYKFSRSASLFALTLLVFLIQCVQGELHDIASVHVIYIIFIMHKLIRPRLHDHACTLDPRLMITLHLNTQSHFYRGLLAFIRACSPISTHAN